MQTKVTTSLDIMSTLLITTLLDIKSKVPMQSINYAVDEEPINNLSDNYNS